MPHTMTWLDRMRIERLVWALDQRLYDLPRQSRIAKRREVRENLRAATIDVGTTTALRNLGNSRQLAADLRVADFGDEARPAWVTAALFFLTGSLFFTAFLGEAASAFGDGIKAVNPNATGTFTWSGIRYLQDTVTYTFADGKEDSVGGAWTPLAWALWLVATVLVGRLWRVVSVWRQRRTRQSA
jgi:hypothetical protein